MFELAQALTVFKRITYHFYNCDVEYVISSIWAPVSLGILTKGDLALPAAPNQEKALIATSRIS